MPKLAQFSCDRCGKVDVANEVDLIEINGETAPIGWSVLRLERVTRKLSGPADADAFTRTTALAFLCDPCTPLAIAFISAASPAVPA